MFPPLQVDLLTLKVVSRVTCDMGYLCANFSLSRPLVLDLRPMYATDRQTSDAHHRLMPLPYGRGIMSLLRVICDFD